jgi:threonine dehydratase
VTERKAVQEQGHVDAGVVRDVMRQIQPHIRRTPMVAARGGGFVKLESLQPTGSFKVRGFFAAALRLDSDQLARGLLTVSAGNAALACAHVARSLNVPCRVVMVDTAPARTAFVRSGRTLSRCRASACMTGS